KPLEHAVRRLSPIRSNLSAVSQVPHILLELLRILGDKICDSRASRLRSQAVTQGTNSPLHKVSIVLTADEAVDLRQQEVEMIFQQRLQWHRADITTMLSQQGQNPRGH